MMQRGFTLIELLLSVTILTLLVGLSLPVYESFVRRNDLDITTQTAVSVIRRAQTYARGVNEDSVWGVRFQASDISLFKGANYVTRDTNFDETLPLPSSMTISGTSEITFAKLTGMPSQTSTITLESSTNDTRTVTVNAEGMVDY